MRIDVQIPAPLRQQVAADFLLPILEGGEIVAEVQATMAAFTPIPYKQTGDLLAPGQPLYSPLEFPTLRTSSLGQICPIVKRRGPSGSPSSLPLHPSVQQRPSLSTGGRGSGRSGIDTLQRVARFTAKWIAFVP
jgi:hypothetical protein